MVFSPRTSLDLSPKNRKMKIATASDLKYAVETSGNEPYFFTRSTMKFFGDTMANYGIRQPREIITQSGETVRAYELVRRRPVKHGLQSSAWFNAETFERVFRADPAPLAALRHHVTGAIERGEAVAITEKTA
jgi:hypothetical protein